MHVSRRISNVKASPTVALNAKAKALAKSGVKVLNFSVGEPDFDTPEPIVERAISALKAGRTKYGPAGGGPEFRQAVVDKLKRDNQLTFEASDVVAGAGAKELLFHLMLAICNDGDEVIIPAPYWVSYPDQVIAAGGKPVILGVTPDMAQAPLDLAELERRSSDKTVAIVLNSPNNPAGYMFDRKFAKELGAYLEKKNWWIISDEIYEYLAFDKEHVSLLQLYPSLKNRFIIVNGMSKGYAMTGWRVGYAAGPEAVIKLVRDLQSHSSTCLPPFIEEAATFALQQGASLLAPQVQTLRERRDQAVAKLQKAPLLSFVAPQGAFYIFLDVRAALAASRTFKECDTLAFSEHLLSKHHVAVVPGDAFGAPGYLRFSYGTSLEVVLEGIDRILQALAALD